MLCTSWLLYRRLLVLVRWLLGLCMLLRLLLRLPLRLVLRERMSPLLLRRTCGLPTLPLSRRLLPPDSRRWLPLAGILGL